MSRPIDPVQERLEHRSPRGWIENRPSRGLRFRADWRELWAWRELVFYLALRDFKLRYTQAVLGIAWVLIQPLAGAVLFYAIFDRVLDAPSDGVAYFVFAYLGLALWAYVSHTVEAASESLAAHSPLVTQVYFPRLVAPVAAVLPGLVDLAIGLVVLGLLMGLYEVVPSLALATLPLWIFSGVAATLAVGLWLAALNGQYRDVRYALGFFMQLWFFATPIAYSSSVVQGAWQYVYALNPLVGVVDGLRWSLLDAPPPGGEDLVSLGVCVLLLYTGQLYFRRVERRLADVI